ncbi:glutamate 5-kinase [Micrococcus porci]|uniref:glutamate 5-kinase n=1 Tax=Micrococcus TaxID=1269 RepID=UPI001CCC8991|nr:MULTISPECIES: glutamate 5-kinase [Micrococcus]MCG7422007.1 glutamate 5-kinase [Micrococcus sp. ACRRV]UBH24044.1 glutamate 5-kinase [Micrococcus porci]
MARRPSTVHRHATPSSRGAEDPKANPVHTRADIGAARRVVIKVGSSSLTTGTGLNTDAIDALVELVARLRGRGTQVVLVSSGAIAAGFPALGLSRRPKDTATQQAAAAVGQNRLVAYYSQSFARFDTTVAQVLLTAEELMRRGQYINAHRALARLLTLDVLPIVNENDAVATREIRFGDNDRLAALTANLVKADLLVLLSDVDALYTGHPSRPGSRRIDTVTAETDLGGVDVRTPGSAGVGTGGMVTKVDAAGIAATTGIPTLLTSAALASAALDGEDVGTWFSAAGRRRTARAAWLGLTAQVRGRLTIDDGAVAGAIDRGRSLLAAGITAAEGDFTAGDVVEIADAQGTVLARGLAAYSSSQLPRMLGRQTAQLKEEIGAGYDGVVVHADDWVRLAPTHSAFR